MRYLKVYYEMETESSQEAMETVIDMARDKVDLSVVYLEVAEVPFNDDEEFVPGGVRIRELKKGE